MQLVDGVHVDPDFPAAQMRQAAFEGIYGKPFIGYFSIARRKDVIVYPAGEQSRLDGDVPGTEINAQVPLQAVFRLQVLVALFIAEGPFVFAVQGEFGQVRCAKTAGDVRPEGEMPPESVHFPSCLDAVTKSPASNSP